MRPGHDPSLTPDVRAAVSWGLDQPVDGETRALSEFLAGAFGPECVALVHYGSRAQGRQPRADSAFDFYVIVDRYRQAYQALAAAVGTSYAPRIATALNRVLAPNVISVTSRQGEERRAKCCVISLHDFQRACSSRRRDHFTQGRLFQWVALTWTRDPAGAEAVREAIADVRAGTFAWGLPSLPDEFTVDEYARTLLTRSLGGEIRPEVGDHARTLVTAQQDALRQIYTPLLTHLVARGALAANGGGTSADSGAVTYRLLVHPTRLDRARVALYFQWSKLRATARLLKHVILYEGWLDYIVRKVERSGDTPIVLSRREQRWPLVFLWPRFFRYLRNRPQRRGSRDAD